MHVGSVYFRQRIFFILVFIGIRMECAHFDGLRRILIWVTGQLIHHSIYLCLWIKWDILFCLCFYHPDFILKWQQSLLLHSSQDGNSYNKWYSKKTRILNHYSNFIGQASAQFLFSTSFFHEQWNTFTLFQQADKKIE